MKKIIPILFLLLFITSVSYPQFGAQKNEHAFSRAVSFTAEGGVTYAFTDFKDPSFKFVGKGSLEYFFPSSSAGAFGLKFFGGMGQIGGEGTFVNGTSKESFTSDIIFVGGGLIYALELNDVIHPYIGIGASYLFSEPNISPFFVPSNLVSIEKQSNDINYNGELGIRFMISDYVSFNLGGMVHINPNDDIDGLVPRGNANDLFYSLGAGFSFYYLVRDKDTDGDGIIDTKDLCPDSPFGVAVDDFGCPKDSDGDGVPDYLDKCNDTPHNVVVDNQGCPLDTDKDGVPDYLDRCAETMPGIAVDANGCPLDRDKDGIPDFKDKCPDSKPGVQVDQFGCEIVEMKEEVPEKPTELVLSGSATFASGKSDLLPAAKSELSKLIFFMKENPRTRWRIEGHTDNTGSYAANKKMSLKRADAVLDYFIRNGLNADRFEVYGLGPDFPVADNSSESGRAKNRRVSIKLIGEMEEETPVIEEAEPEVNLAYDVSNEKNIESTIFTDGKLFCIQLSSWRTEEKAAKETARLLNEGKPAYMVKAYLPSKGSTWYRVRIGYFKSLEEAREYLKSM